jgi:prepilin-type processing-associated H-X9-DG protein
MNETSVKQPRHKHEFSPLRVLAGVLVGVTVLAYLIGPRPIPRERANRVICMANLHALYVALNLYAGEYGNAYPPPEKWCDLLVNRFAREESFQCREAMGQRCAYAMNPRADRLSAPDVVLLLESIGGWNQFGGSELLTTERHKGGCNVLFVGGEVKFVKAEEIPALRWESRDNGRDEEK